jgi:hypothetical protein
MKHIHPDPHGYRVEVERNGVRFRACIPFGSDRAAALRQARSARNEFLAGCAAIKSRSNTGVAGVTELTHWTSGLPQTCFVVTHGKPCPNWKRRFFYKTFAQRQRQLVRAIHHRARIAGENVNELLEAAHA